MLFNKFWQSKEENGMSHKFNMPTHYEFIGEIVDVIDKR